MKFIVKSSHDGGQNYGIWQVGSFYLEEHAYAYIERTAQRNPGRIWMIEKVSDDDARKHNEMLNSLID